MATAAHIPDPRAIAKGTDGGSCMARWLDGRAEAEVQRVFLFPYYNTRNAEAARGGRK